MFFISGVKPHRWKLVFLSWECQFPIKEGARPIFWKLTPKIKDSTVCDRWGPYYLTIKLSLNYFIKCNYGKAHKWSKRITTWISYCFHLKSNSDIVLHDKCINSAFISPVIQHKTFRWVSSKVSICTTTFPFPGLPVPGTSDSLAAAFRDVFRCAGLCYTVGYWRW